MSEPRTYLANYLPQLLQLRIPVLLNPIIRARGKVDGKVSDLEVLRMMGFISKARAGSRYKLVYNTQREDLAKRGLNLVYEDEKKSTQTISGPGLNMVIYLMCENIINDLTTQLRDINVWQSPAFIHLSRTMTYNPFYKIAALIPLTGCKTLPASLGLILMDQKLSMVSLSFMLRMTAMSKDLKTRYDDVTYDQPGSAIHGIGCTGWGDPTYNILIANGTYERVLAKWEGVVRKGREEYTYKKLKPLTFSQETCSWT
jgi:hypothetical protein